jgi:hypothetical protein
MSKSLVLFGTVALAAVIGVGTALSRSGQPPAPAATAPAAPAPYVMTLGDMMDTLIQPRHAKLGLAGRAQNWPLAQYALVELRQAFAGIVKAQPQFHGLPVGELVNAAVSQPLNAVDAAIGAQDPKKFAVAYDQLTRGCNACHAAVDHPFVVIKAPESSAFPNQDFSPHK